MTINKSQGQTLSRIGLDLRSSVFSHGQLYVALSRAQNRDSIMCLLPESHIIDGVPYTENIVYPPFIDAATLDHSSDNASSNGNNPGSNSFSGEQSGLPPGSNDTNDDSDSLDGDESPPDTPPWSTVAEIGDGACMLRCVSRHVYGTPHMHQHVRAQIILHISNNLHVQFPDFGGLCFFDVIDNGTNTEYIKIAGQAQQQYTSVPEYLLLMSLPTTYATNVELRSASLLFQCEFRVTLIGEPLPPPPSHNTCDLLYNGFNHYNTLKYNAPS